MKEAPIQEERESNRRHKYVGRTNYISGIRNDSHPRSKILPDDHSGNLDHTQFCGTTCAANPRHEIAALLPRKYVHLGENLKANCSNHRCVIFEGP